MCILVSMCGNGADGRPAYDIIDADGGQVTASQLSGPENTFQPSNTLDPYSGVYFTVSNTQQVQMPLDTLAPNTNYVLNGTVSVIANNAVLQFAILDGSTSIGASLVNTIGDEIALVFTTPADVSALRLHVSGNNDSVSISNLRIDVA